MPVYDYICNDCHKEFETVLTLDEHDHQNIKCPKCGSKNVEQEVAAFFAVTSKKSERTPQRTRMFSFASLCVLCSA